MKGMRKFASPNEYGWLSYGITFSGKLVHAIGQLMVKIEKAELNKGEDYVRRNDSAESERNKG